MKHSLNAQQITSLNMITGWAVAGFADTPFMVLSGSPGTGKSYLVSQLLKETNRIRQIRKTLKMEPLHEVVLTATTNRAVASLKEQVDADVLTMHAYLGILMKPTPGRRNHLTAHYINNDLICNTLIIIDEFSYITEGELSYLSSRIGPGSAVLLVGDADQLLKQGCTISPVVNKGYPYTELTLTERYDPESAIGDLVRMFKHAVRTGEFYPVRPDGESFIHYTSDQAEEYQKDVLETFQGNPDTRVLAWTNKTVMEYNHWLMNALRGDPFFAVGDRVLVNQYHSYGGTTIRNEEIVVIAACSIPGQDEYTSQHAYPYTPGKFYQLKGHSQGFFVPTDPKAKERILTELCNLGGDPEERRLISDTWIDIRPYFSSTINKSQGITCDNVFIDVRDVSRCRDANQLARLLNVGASRARKRVVMFGDL